MTTDPTSGAAPDGGVPDDASELEGLPPFSPEGAPASEGAGAAPASEDDHLARAIAESTELTADLQRLQAEYVNYRKRVERDRSVARDQAIISVVEAMIPVLDDLDQARAHGDLTGPFAAIADKYEAVLTRFGWERYGAVGEVFDPQVHDALMHVPSTEYPEPSVTAVLQAGHRVGERIVRAARVAVSDPGAEA